MDSKKSEEKKDKEILYKAEVNTGAGVVRGWSNISAGSELSRGVRAFSSAG